MKKLFILRQPSHLQALIGFLSQNWEACSKDGKPLAVEIKPEKSKRSLEQNRRYFSMLREISDQVWLDARQYAPEIWHEWFKREFIGVIDLPGGKTMAMSSTDLNVKEFKDFSDRVEAYAATELGVQFIGIRG